MATTACDSLTGVRLRVEAGHPIEPGCIAGLETAVGPVDAFLPVKQDEASTAQEVTIQRGSGSVYVHRESSSSQLIQLGFGWLGPTSERQERDSVTLLADVLNAVLRTCGMQADKVRVSSQCNGSVCRFPEIAAMSTGQEGGEARKE